MAKSTAKTKRTAPAAAPEVVLRIEQGGKKNKPPKTDDPQGEATALLALLRDKLQGGSGLEVRLWRYNDAAREDEYLPPLRLEDFDGLETVRQIYGGGRYYLRVAKADSGQFVSVPGMTGRFEFRIAGPPKHPDQGAASSGTDVQFAELRADIRRLAERPTAASGPNETVGKMAMEMATAMSTVMATTMKLAQQGAPVAGAAQGGGGMMEMLELLDAIEERAERRRGHGGNGGGGNDALVSGLMGIADRAFDEIRRARQLKAGAPVVAPNPNPGAEPPPAGATDTDTMDVSKLAPAIRQLVALADENADPELYADVLLDRLRRVPEVLELFEATTTREARSALQQRVADAYPAVAQRGEWFVKLWDAIWSALDAPPEPEA